jgi:subtilisin family serine protease
MGDGYEYFTGTSAAAPYVTGSAALVWAANPSLNYADVKRLLLETSDSSPSLQGKTLSGGRLNVGRALQNSPAQGGTLLNGSSPLPLADLSPQSNSADSGGGCSLASTAQGKVSAWIWGIGLVLISLKRRKAN